MNQMQQMLMQAQKMQRQLQKAHAELEQKEFTVEKAGLVTVVLTGNKKVKSIAIDKDALNPDDAEMVEETIVSAINEAIEKITAEANAIDEEITGRSGGLY